MLDSWPVYVNIDPVIAIGLPSPDKKARPHVAHFLALVLKNKRGLHSLIWHGLITANVENF